MARMSIYVPDDLKGRMDALSDRVNWSGIAQAAFEIEIGRYPKWTEDRMTAVIERLRASKQRQAEAMGDVGAVAGKKWAEEEAEYINLKAVAESELDDTDADDIGWDAIPGMIGFGDRSEAESFWEEQIGEHWRDEVNGHLQLGFFRAAKAVWEEVRDQL